MAHEASGFRSPLGVSDFRTLREDELTYVDKTAFISAFIRNATPITQLLRPRRFGKTLLLSMLAAFLGRDEEDLSPLFEGLDVSSDPEARCHFQKYPVVFVSFKDIKTTSMADTFDGIRVLLQNLFLKHEALLKTDTLEATERRRFELILQGEGSRAEISDALAFLTRVLHRHFGEKVVVLVDEYDTPIQSGYLHGFFDEVVLFFRNLFSAVFKENPSLYRGILTGILRVSKENLFSGLNNLVADSVLSEAYEAACGFTPKEVEALFETAGIDSGARDEVLAWYNGYTFGKQTIYNPWSVLNYAKTQRVEPYWVNTSSNDLIMDFVAKRGFGLRPEMEALLHREPIEVEIRHDVTLRDLHLQPGALWTFLLYSGYLKAETTRLNQGRTFATLSIVNREVRLVYEDVFRQWMQYGLMNIGRIRGFLSALLNGDTETIEDQLEHFLLTMTSFQDPTGRSPETLYHGFILGLLVLLETTHNVRSNRETGFGRADVLIIPKIAGEAGVVMELKVVRKKREGAKEALRAAARQVRDRAYRTEVEVAGAGVVHELVVVFDGKEAWCRTVDEVLAESFLE